jgi:hypothetical protein
MIRDEEKPLHDLPETRGMTAREALAVAIAHARGYPMNALEAIGVGFGDDADDLMGFLQLQGFQVLPAIPVPIGKEVW